MFDHCFSFHFYLQVFFITAGETRIDSLPYAAEDGWVQWAPTVYVMSYILIVNWVFLQVDTF